ncbi:MAG: polysaccharide deacetylase family protein [Clostridiales bacterium]
MKRLSMFLVLTLIIGVFFTACSKSDNEKESKESDKESSSETKKLDSKEETKKAVKINYEEVKPNESGKVMVVMFHNFVEEFEAQEYDSGEYTTTFDDFEKLLPNLYEKGYRLVSLNDFLKNDIDVPAGTIPMIFTFDDATSGQFNLIKSDGKLKANPKTAVGIMEKFNKEHSDFGMEATFFVNLGVDTFEGKGTLAERLKYLVDKGFEIGNHTYTHINLKDTQSSEEIIKEVGGNQKKMSELIPNYKFNTFSLPFGAPTVDLIDDVVKGEFEGEKYKHAALMEVGWDPNLAPVNPEFNPLSVHRVRASGIEPVQADLAWWMDNISREEQFVSDGDPDKISIPQDKKGNVDESKLQDKKLVVY